jgi:hypothetical protein
MEREQMRVFEKKSVVLSLVIMMTALLLMGAGAGCAPDDNVKEVKAQAWSVTNINIYPEDSGETFGATMERYCPGGSWSQFTSTSYQPVVEYSGGNSPQGKVDIQFVQLTPSNWTAWVVVLDGRELTDSEIITFFKNAKGG